MMAGNFRLLTLSVLPTGEKHKTTLRSRRTLSIKKRQQFSLVSSMPCVLASLRTAPI